MTVASEDLVEVRALDELHGDERVSVDLAEIVDRDDVGVLQRAGRLGLAEKSAAQVGVAGERVAHHLDGDGPVEHRIEGAIHDPHGPFADLAEDAVFADLFDLAFRHTVQTTGEGTTEPVIYPRY